jgi:hypothetical protein
MKEGPVRSLVTNIVPSVGTLAVRVRGNETSPLLMAGREVLRFAILGIAARRVRRDPQGNGRYSAPV